MSDEDAPQTRLLRRQFYGLSLSLAALWALMVAVLVSQAHAESVDALPPAPLLEWLYLPGIIALCGVAVQWGATRERLKDVGTLRTEMNDRLVRIENQIDKLFSLLGAERRSPGRLHYGERVRPQEEDT